MGMGKGSKEREEKGKKGSNRRGMFQLP